ncbi:hypothetical protein [Flavobacterium frigoris]|jgi:hypothetical protein|uniref:Uncharacterized protein n=1 Tax=Flavobacterium frigoris (strain PS1) TaxID=1086011 RepID=H7FVM7_FLAFP|nr:hypothetical protein [Flavobacterium frigoris]EIA07449.1 hypothetical protein HJ01_03252 [Flavobacterium frigoris PS1]
MPRLLKNDTVRLIEASIEALGLAQFGICTFRRDQLKIEQVRYSAEIGLIGCSIELAMSAILIQALGKKSIFRDYESGKYKTASEILSDFRSLLRQSSSNILFLINGVSKSEEHINRILELTNRFQLIITSRANGLHNGYGLKYELVASLFQNVSEFLYLISNSNNLKPYLTKIPELVGIKIDKDILIDDLYNKLRDSKNAQEQKILISSLFLILPEIPKKLPEWIEKFESLKIAPKKTDIVYLIDALEKANPVSLNKVTDSSNQLNVKIVGRDVEDAIPISAQFLKSEFTQIRDQFYADIATANGRLNSKQLDLPPKSSIYNAFAFGVDELQILEKGKEFTAHQTWPFIVEAINVAKNNTSTPYWFLIRMTNDLGQLKSCLKKAYKYGNSSLKKNITIVLGGIEAIENEKYIESNSVFIQQIISETETFISNIDKLESVYKKNGLNGLTDDYENDLEELFLEEKSISELLAKLLQDESVSDSCKKHWVAKLTSLMPEKDDLPIFANILDNIEFKNAHTNIRKVFRANDFADYGPKIKSA